MSVHNDSHKIQICSSLLSVFVPALALLTKFPFCFCRGVQPSDQVGILIVYCGVQLLINGLIARDTEAVRVRYMSYIRSNISCMCSMIQIVCL